MKRLENKVVLIADQGAGSTGTTIAEILREQGAKVMLADTDEEALKVAVNRLGIGSGDDLAYSVTDTKDSQKETVDRFGQVDIVISFQS